MEVWKDISGFEGFYQISNLGNVKSLGRLVKSGSGKRENQVRWHPERILKPTVGKVGYKVINLRKGSDSRHDYIHRLMANEFIQQLKDGLEVDHIDGDKLNNSLSNLRVCSAQKNLWNVKKRLGNYTSKFKGVCFDKVKNKFKAEITINYKSKHLGYFKTEEEAAECYNKEALKLFNNFARINVL